MPSDEVEWASVRERDVALAAGLRVVRHGAAGIQIQTLGPGPGETVQVVSVAPGDVRHLALWETLLAGEAKWGN